MNITRRQLLNLGGAGLASQFGAFSAASTSRPNVLFIAVDDLRPSLGCYGTPQVQTPNIDKLARSGVVFRRAYCQMAVCNPTRSSLLTGLRPDSTQVFDLRTHFRKHVPDVVTLPQRFKQNGYFTQSFGKVFHNGLEDPPSWSVPAWPEDRNRGMEYIDEEKLAQLRAAGKADGMKAWDFPRLTWKKMNACQWPDVPDDALQDGEATTRAIEALHKIKDRSFFLSVGYLKPHMPFVAPKKYFDLYSRESLERMPNPFPVKGAPRAALHAWEELRGYRDIPKEGPLTAEKTLELIHGYYAATSYMDAQVGRLMTELHKLGLADNTIVVLWGDHGFHLGEQDLWCKATNFELDTRSPLIVSAPGAAKGQHAAGLVEFVDIYPTLCEMCGLTPPGGMEGHSFAPLLRQPSRPWKKAAFSQFGRPWLNDSKWKVMGYSIRTERHRYSEWRDRSGALLERELYDYSQSEIEVENIAERPENAGLVTKLSQALKAGWSAALPDRSSA